MDLLIIHDEIGADARPDELDDLVQVETVAAALTRLGHRPRRLAVGLDLQTLRGELRARRPDLVFNLVEAPGRSGRLIHLPIALVEAEGIPCTGADQTGMLLSSNKLAAKRIMALAGLPTAPFHAEAELESMRLTELESGVWIVKSVWEHGSLGLDEDSVIETRSAKVLGAELRRRHESLGGEGFAEAYVDGREFNISVLAMADGPTVLPPAEIQFVGYGPDKNRVIGYRAKWAEGSFEFENTPRSFDFAAADRPLLDRLEELSRRAFVLFDLGGHARVDFRVDADGRPFILEVNANPCIAPDAGFVAAADRAGLGLDGAVAAIVACALRRNSRPEV